MEGYIVNNSGKTVHIFKRKFPAGHKVELYDIWPQYKDKVCRELGKKSITENEFIKWLEDNSYMMDGFEYYATIEKVKKEKVVTVETASEIGEIIESTEATIPEDLGEQSDGQLVKPSLSSAKPGVIDKLTYKDIADLRVIDDPKKIVYGINNVHKLRRAYTLVRNMPRKSMLEKILRERIQELERLG
jgi:hypothetical protein